MDVVEGEEDEEGGVDAAQPYVPVKITPARSAWLIYSLETREVVKVDKPGMYVRMYVEERGAKCYGLVARIH